MPWMLDTERRLRMEEYQASSEDVMHRMLLQNTHLLLDELKMLLFLEHGEEPGTPSKMLLYLGTYDTRQVELLYK